MNSFFRIHLAPVLAMTGVLAVASGMMASRAQADQWNKKTILTVNEPIQVTDTVLDPGKYVFMLENSSSDRHIVRIFNEDQTRLVDTVMAMPNYRIQPTGNSRFMFWETPPGTARALRAWFYPGDNFGQEFPYPKHPKTLTARFGQEFPYPKHPKTLTAQATAPAPAVTAQERPAPQEAAPSAEAQPAPESQPAPEVSQQTAPAEQPAEVAQNNPPAPAPEAQPAPQQQPPARELPQTSSPYTWFGFTGVVLLGLAGLLRLKRWA